MGGLRKYMPVTFWTSLIGTLALVGTPFFSGFYSKDTIIEAAAEHAHEGGGWIAQYGYMAVLLGAFVTAFYSFRLLYMTFFGKERFRDTHDDHARAAHADTHGATHAEPDTSHDDHGHHGPVEPRESPWVVTLPLVLLAIPSVVIGFFTVGPMLFGTDMLGHAKQLPFFLGAIDVPEARDVVAKIAEEAWHGPVAFALHGFLAPAFWLAFAGFALATLMYVIRPDLPDKAGRVFALPIRVLKNKYGMDDLWIKGFAGGGLLLGRLSRRNDDKVIDGAFVNGSARLVDLFSGVLRRTQTGHLYNYAFVMIVGLIVLLAALIHYWR